MPGSEAEHSGRPRKPFGDAGRDTNSGHMHSSDFSQSYLGFWNLARSVVAAVCLLSAGCGRGTSSSDPGLVWISPSTITYGTGLSPAQLNAAARVPGNFEYTPAAGTIVPAGPHTHSVTFTPADTARYHAASATTTLIVNKAKSVIDWNAPAPIVYGTPLGAVQLDANARTLNGVFTYTPGAGTVLSAGPQLLSVTFTPDDNLNNESVSVSAALTVNKATPTIYWPKPEPIASGTPLNGMQLDAVSSGTSGTLSYSPPADSVLSVGSHVLSATFAPIDLQNYATVTTTQTITVVDATPPVITLQPRDQSIDLGQSAIFTVSATGQGLLAYQWRRNSVFIPGATAPSYTTSQSVATDDGSSYSVVVSDGVQQIISISARLSVLMPFQKSYYISANGSDQADGSEARPFATLQRAQLAMRMSATKVTQIEGGTYYLTSPLVLTEADRGETWKTVPGATAILSGGEVIKGWSSESNGIYSAKALHPVLFDLTISGIRQVPAARGYDPDQPYTSGWNVITPSQKNGYSSTFNVRPGDLTASVKPGAIVQLIDHCQWNDIFTRITSVDSSNDTITVVKVFDTGSSAGLVGNWRVLSDPADLSVTSQFAFDPVGSRVYIMPESPETINSDTVVAARLGTLVSLKSVSGITISGLTFSDTTSNTIQQSGTWDDSQAAIMAENLNGSTISGNTFLNVGKGVVLEESSNNVIVGNSFKRIGVSGISLFSDSNRNSITNNSLIDIGQVNLLSYAISINDSSFNLVDSNFIDGAGRWGIVFGPSGDPDLDDDDTGNTLSNNVILNTSNRTNDSGAIYGGARTIDGYFDEKLLITGNRIENVGGLVRRSDGTFAAGFAQGIYLDDHLSGVTLTDNVIESGSTYGAVLCHGCKGNVARNNVVILQPAPVYDRSQHGSTFASGDMNFNGVTRIDLLPSYFHEGVNSSAIVVQLSGQAYGGTSAMFDLQVDGVTVGTGTASDTISNFKFKIGLVPHQVHRIGIALTNGADSGVSTTSLHDLAIVVNNTAVKLAAPEATGHYGSYGFAAIPDDLMVSNFSANQNIIYRNGGLSQDVYDMTPAKYPAYVDPSPGTINSNLLFMDIAGAHDPIFGGQALDVDSLFADPQFADPSHGDYRIQEGSPALALGFKSDNVPLGP